MWTTIAFETAFAVLLRLILLFSCRKYLLQNLYHDLQDLSSEPGTTSSRTDDSDIDMQTLPTSTSPSQASKPNNPRDVARRHLLHSVLARTSFAACFSESCMMFMMLMFQGLNILHPRTRAYSWRVSLFLLLTTILVFTPSSMSLIITLGASSTASHLRKHSAACWAILSLVPILLYLYALSYIPLPSALPSSDLLTSVLARLIVLGTIILGFLSGFGAINNAWAFFPLFAGIRQEPSNENIVASEQSLARIRSDLRERRMQIRLWESRPKPEGSWLSRMVPSFRSDSQHSGLVQEVAGLEALEYQMARSLDELRLQRDMARLSATFKGKLFNVGGRLFAVYCVVRVVSSTVNVLTPRSSSSSTATYPDLITHLLAYILFLFPTHNVEPEDVAILSRQISLGMVGIIILSSIRLVLRGVMRILRVTSRNMGASIMLLVLTQLMGIYLLSTVVQLRTSFPPHSELGLDSDNLFSSVPEYEVFGSLFDWSFLCAAGVTAFSRWAGGKVDGIGQS